MQWTWRMAAMCLRAPLRVAFSRWGIWKRLCLAGFFCSLCVILYYQHVTSNRAQVIPVKSDSNHFLVASSSLQSFTEISKHFTEVSKHEMTPEEHRFNQNVRRTPEVVTINVTQQTTSNLESLRGENGFGKLVAVDSEPKEVKSTAKSSEKSKRYFERVKLPRVLLLYGSDGYRASLEAKIFLESHRIPFHFSSFSKAHDLIAEKFNLTSNPKHLFNKLSLVIIVSYYTSKSVGPYLEFCRRNKLPLIWATLPGLHSQNFKLRISNLRTNTVTSTGIRSLMLSPNFPFYFGRPGAAGQNFSPPHKSNWTVFSLVKSGDSHMITDLHSLLADKVLSETRPPTSVPKSWDHDNTNYRTLVEISVKSTTGVNGGVEYSNVPVVVEDKGAEDGVRKLMLGTPHRYWVTHLVLMEGVRLYCGEELLREGRERMVMVDIDDIFLAPEGRKMNRSDVQAMLKAQKEIRSLVPGFTFNAGFVGSFYDRGLESEKLGNQELVLNADQLWWFGHTYRHKQPHLMSLEELTNSMKFNKAFAQNHGIQASDHHYSVAPHHSGVYPVYPPLYKTWREIWNISVTSTEEYPDLRPDHRRRGFIHNGINVLPRQTCRLFTHTFLYSHFPGGRQQVLSFARGGEVFLSVLRNPVSIFMTHTPNYCCDRLALTLLPALFQFISHWTQLELSSPNPLKMADQYFSLYPEDAMPLWTSPCNVKRHREIWPSRLNCSRLPSLLILGPQKSGTTALHAFLQLHPLIMTNKQTELHYEEVQFFSDDLLYQRGIDWYMDQFPYPPTLSSTNSSLSPPPPPPPLSPIIFEKSATYFSHPLVPSRVHSLLPRATLLIILADPSHRAYSWYQHQRAHSDPTALHYTFSQVLNASIPTSTPPPPLLSSLSSHCLSPGHYHTHISNWLQFFDPAQLMLIDGDELVDNPADVMDTVMQYINLPPHPYQEILQYDQRKGFFCIIKNNGKKKCLGKSKGRSYPPMSDEDKEWLATYYAPHNLQLRKLLTKLGRPFPDWLFELPPPLH